MSTGFKPDLKRWIELRFTIRGADFEYEIHPMSTFTDIPQPESSRKKTLGYEADIVKSCILALAAMFAVDPDEASNNATNFLNSRLNSPTMRSGCSNNHILVKWDFSLKISTDNIVDVSGNRAGAENHLINALTRAVTGYDWDGTESDWTKAKYGYGAISWNFHRPRGLSVDLLMLEFLEQATFHTMLFAIMICILLEKPVLVAMAPLLLVLIQNTILLRASAPIQTLSRPVATSCILEVTASIGAVPLSMSISIESRFAEEEKE